MCGRVPGCGNPSLSRPTQSRSTESLHLLNLFAPLIKYDNLIQADYYRVNF